MSANTRLTDRLVQDLNSDQRLPFADSTFDTVIIANSIEFLVKPREVLREVNPVLREVLCIKRPLMKRDPIP